jgi:tetratricopeptide (TPR) repeat protein
MKLKAVLFSLLLLVVLTSKTVFADYKKPIITKVPLYRLVLNLEKQKDTDPDEAHNYYALGRLYAMAYAQKGDSMEAILRIGESDYIPYYGFQETMPNFFFKATKDSVKNAFSRECLNRAISNFKEAVKLDSTDLPSLLGLAWSVDQMGNKTEARSRYIAILRKAMKYDRNDYTSIETAETAGYLVRLLNPQMDKEEIAALNDKIKKFKPTYMISPVLIPLVDNADINELVNNNAKVKFDLDATRQVKQWQWLSPKAGWLVYLNDNVADVTSGVQLMGNVSFNIFWENGYKAMSSLDDNANGLIDGKELKNLAVWNDKNSNGISEKSELTYLTNMDVESLTYQYTKENKQLLKNDKGIKFKNGKTRPTFDWFPKCQNPAL